MFVCTCVQRVVVMSSDVSVMECVFQHVSCVMATRSVVITVMNTTVITTTVSLGVIIMVM